MHKGKSFQPLQCFSSRQVFYRSSGKFCVNKGRYQFGARFIKAGALDNLITANNELKTAISIKGKPYENLQNRNLSESEFVILPDDECQRTKAQSEVGHFIANESSKNNHNRDTIESNSKDSAIMVISNEVEPKTNVISIEVRQKAFRAELAKMKREAVVEKTTENICPKPYHRDGDQNEFNIDAEIGPTIEDWELGPYAKINREMPGQTLYKAESEDIAILAKSKWKFFDPNQSPDGLVYRIVRLADDVSSPLGRIHRNMRVGVREDDRWRVVFGGYLIGVVCIWLGFWQLRRIRWKRDLIELRRNRMTAPMEIVNSGPLPWKDDIDNWKFRIVQMRGVLDSSKPLCVGPRDSANKGGHVRIFLGKPYFAIFNVLRLEDGTTILVNRGHVDLLEWWKVERPIEMPRWVTVRGVLHPGEEPGFARWLTQNYIGNVVRGAKAKGEYFSFIEPAVLAQHANVTDVDSTGVAVIEALDMFYDEDIGKLPGERPERDTVYRMVKKGDFFQFWCSEHTHFNYAMQWFLLALFATGTVTMKYFDVRRWKF